MSNVNPLILEGSLQVSARPVALVAARFNQVVVERLLHGAHNALIRHGFRPEHLSTIWVPGAYDMPLIVQKVAASGQVSGIIALGAVIRGDTYHFEVVANNNASALMQLMLRYALPIVNAVLTTDTLEQAFDRAGGKAGNKGYDAALALIELLSLCDGIAEWSASRP